MTDLTVVIPTYNRGVPLLATVRNILEAQADGLKSVQVLVVDDGSVPAAATVLGGLQATAPFTLRVLRQDNGGPARARNLGFGSATGDLVLFIDDDILIPPDLLRQHVAAHLDHEGSVICGRCAWKLPERPGAVFRLLARLGYEVPDRGEDFVPIPIVASGQISVRRAAFEMSVYRDDLVTPAAEEYELSLRLGRMGLRSLLAQRITAIHDSPVSLAALCRQQYKHGVGCAEAAQRVPDTLRLPELAAIIDTNGPAQTGSLKGNLRKGLKGVLSASWPRAMVLKLACVVETSFPQADAFAPIYRMVIGLYFTAGVRDGLSRFAAARARP